VQIKTVYPTNDQFGNHKFDVLFFINATCEYCFEMKCKLQCNLKNIASIQFKTKLINAGMVVALLNINVAEY
jgi:hypothetical protein